MELQVLIPSDISEAGKQYLRDRGYEIKMGRGLDEDTIIADAQGCDAMLVRNRAHHPPDPGEHPSRKGDQQARCRAGTKLTWRLPPSRTFG